MKLTILGTGTFFINEKQSAPSYLLEVDKKKILIDCGPGTLMRLSQVNIKPEDLDCIFITHFHADHTSDLFPLIMNIRLLDFFNKKGLKKYPQIFGPKGIEKFAQSISRIYQLPSLKGWGKLKFVDYGKDQTLDNIKVIFFKVKHAAFGVAAKAYALRFLFKEKTIVFSGDTVKCVGIEKACQGADLFICDTSYSKKLGNGAHMDTYDIGEIAEKGNVKKVVLTHLYPQYEKVDLVSEVKEKYSGKVVRGKDLMKVEI